MSTKRKKLYTLPWLLLLCLLLCGCGAGKVSPAPDASVIGRMELSYAQQFTVDYYDDGSTLITIAGTDPYLLLPPGLEAPAHDTEAVLLRQPLDTLYLAASSAMDLFLQLDALDQIRMTSTNASNWALPQVAEALGNGSMLYAGKYSAPDFELILSEGCDLAIESTMIYHSPDIQEKLESLGVPVLVERSSYESHPLGRVEWIKLYGLLLGKEDEAKAFFEQQVRSLADLDLGSVPEQIVAFFHINSTGSVVVRKSTDYVSRMIELAGGRYAFDDLGGEENALSTVNMQMESFYAGARDADVLIYNSTIDGDLETLEQLLSKSDLLADFKAVKDGNVWCTGQNMFQQSSACAGMIKDFYAILSGQADMEDSLSFMHRLK